MAKKKTVKSTKQLKMLHAGSFGSRYGVGIRKRFNKVAKSQKASASCPTCKYEKIKRKSRGIFECKKCGLVFAGGAYLPVTMTGGIISRMVIQKSFMASVAELTEASEVAKGEIEKDENEAA